VFFRSCKIGIHTLTTLKVLYSFYSCFRYFGVILPSAKDEVRCSEDIFMPFTFEKEDSETDLPPLL